MEEANRPGGTLGKRSLKNRGFLHVQVAVQSSCTLFWQQWNFRALRPDLLGKQSKKECRWCTQDTGYGCGNWTLQFSGLISDNQNNFPVTWFWPHLGSADAWAPDSACRRGPLTQLCCAALPLCSAQLMGPVPTQPHDPTPICSDSIHQTAKTLLPFGSYCLPITEWKKHLTTFRSSDMSCLIYCVKGRGSGLGDWKQIHGSNLTTAKFCY